MSSDFPGMGVMIGMLGGNADTVKAIQGSIGKKIESAELKDDILVLSFKDNTRLKLWDGGQSCCESRYMNCDDDLLYFTNTVLKGVEIRDAPDVETEYDTHEVQFLVVTTGKGVITVSNHNEHNGCYGGFWIQASVEQGEDR